MRTPFAALLLVLAASCSHPERQPQEDKLEDTSPIELGKPLPSEPPAVAPHVARVFVTRDRDAIVNLKVFSEKDQFFLDEAKEVQAIVYFAEGKIDLDEASKTILNAQAAFLKRNPDLKVELRGYASASNNQKSNKTLSKKRASAVLEYLKTQGLAASQISVLGLGEGTPGTNSYPRCVITVKAK